MRRLTSKVIREMLRLKSMGLNNTQISASVGKSRPKVIEYLKKAQELGLDWEQTEKIKDDELIRLFHPESGLPRYKKPEPDFQAIHDELKRHKSLNLRFLWTEYKSQDADGLEYSQFCARYREWAQRHNVTMVVDREPGYEMQVDWAGDKLEILCDRDTGEMSKAHFFVATLGFSGYPYCEAFADEKMNSWLSAHIHALEYFGGVPRVLIPDNCKTATNRPNYYDPEINKTYQEFSEHYAVAIVPARVAEPQDKPVVEGSVGWLETWLLGRLRKRVFFTLAELNENIAFLLEELVNQPFQKRPGSRFSQFQEYDRPALRPLPTGRFEQPDWKEFSVPDNYHVPYDEHYYSVPYTYHRQRVAVRATSTMIEVFLNGLRICSHARSYSRRANERYITDPEHMPESHRKYREFKQWDGDRYRSWARSIGDNAGHVVDQMLLSKKFEEQAYKACMGVLQLGSRYGQERLEAACAKARSLNSYSFSTVQNILKNGQDKVIELNYATDSIPVAHHENERGASYYC